ncbi:hypothetical protein C1645_838911 [Glomus cerebriforme]|uniref:Uncharacterized protein n=1 Tax=Glomus cerebriforme TaxID=658196 RepID=A0A397SD64_9GLOM|nr:hypothetical protein C1645_838911 [Glomus cerebriforme]
MAHSINLITKDLCKHTFIINTIKKIGIIHQYFVKSHSIYQFLKNAVEVLQIKGGGLKSYIKIRWSTMWDYINSIARLELVLLMHESEIKNQIKDILNDQNFFSNCQIIASILYPLKVFVGCLESRTSTLTTIIFI